MLEGARGSEAERRWNCQLWRKFAGASTTLNTAPSSGGLGKVLVGAFPESRSSPVPAENAARRAKWWAACLRGGRSLAGVFGPDWSSGVRLIWSLLASASGTAEILNATAASQSGSNNKEKMTVFLFIGDLTGMAGGCSKNLKQCDSDGKNC